MGKSTKRAEKVRQLSRHLPHWVLSGVMFAGILWLTLASKPVGDIQVPLFPGADKLAHGILFFVFEGVLLFDALRFRSWKALKLPLISLMAFIGMGVGIGTEALQEAMHTGRTFEWGDMMADTFGVICADAVWMLVLTPVLSLAQDKIDTRDLRGTSDLQTKKGEE